jgi:hypothetical protein
MKRALAAQKAGDARGYREALQGRARFKSVAMARGDFPTANCRKMRRTTAASISLIFCRREMLLTFSLSRQVIEVAKIFS